MTDFAAAPAAAFFAADPVAPAPEAPADPVEPADPVVAPGTVVLAPAAFSVVDASSVAL